MATTATGDPDHQALAFALDDQRYCVPIGAVAEIVDRPEDITALPETPPHVAGVVDLRGETTTIVDPKQLLDRPGDPDGRRVVVFAGDGDRVGWVVDETDRVIGFDDEDVDDTVTTDRARGVVRTDDGFVVWVDHEHDT